MQQVYDEQIADTKNHFREHLQDFPELEQELYLRVREDTLNAERSAIGEASRRGLISRDIHDEMVAEINNHIRALEMIKENRGLDGE
jgi:hypothetical protein